MSAAIDEVQAWVDTHWDEALTVREWWRRLFDAGYSYPSWPAGAGGSDTNVGEARAITGVLATNRVVAPPVGHVAATLAAPTLLAHASPEQVATLVRDIALGEASWCQLFSEPSSGSDLASVGAKAVRDGDEWVITGQKVWNSAANLADVGMLLARTDPDQPKHRGLTYFAIDMHQPGVTVHPLKTMSGTNAFCEVFLDEARVPLDGVIGDLNGGWRVAQTTLMHERNSVAGGGAKGLVAAVSGQRGDLDRTCREVIERARLAAENKSPIRGGAVSSKLMVELANRYAANNDAVTRQALARYLTDVKVNGWTMRRISAAGGALTGADGSIAKVTTSRVCQASRELSFRIVGAHAMLSGDESPLQGTLVAVGLASPGTRIGGGTDEIQLNVLAERALGLPREPADDIDTPYRDLKVGTQPSR